MAKIKNAIFLIICVLLVSFGFAGLKANKPVISAEMISKKLEKGDDSQKENGGEISPRWLASLSMSLNGGNGKIWATVKNDFQLFPSTVNVIVQLFYSYSYCEDYNKMTLATIDSIEDLNMGTTITVETSTDGEERFWMARMRYRENSGIWEERVVSGRFSATGDYMSLT